MNNGFLFLQLLHYHIYTHVQVINPLHLQGVRLHLSHPTASLPIHQITDQMVFLLDFNALVLYLFLESDDLLLLCSYFLPEFESPLLEGEEQTVFDLLQSLGSIPLHAVY